MTEDNFKKAMRDVKPLSQDSHKPHRTVVKARRRQPQTPETLVPYIYDFNLIDSTSWVDGEATLSYRQAGVQKKSCDDLGRGKSSWQARIDLHHYTAGEAMAAIDRFIEEAVIEGLRVLLVIHGKGSMSRHDKPILKNMLAQHLRQSSNVIAYHSAKPRDGGSGALYVLLKSSTKV